jgi:hypothetical protein
MTVQLFYQDGPLDGEVQLVANLPTASDPGSLLAVSLPTYQTFAEDGTTVIDLGLQADYLLVGQTAVDTDENWGADMPDSAWIYSFAGEVWVPRPPFVPEPPLPAPPDTTVLMDAEAYMEVDPMEPVAGVVMVGESGLEVDATSSAPQ